VRLREGTAPDQDLDDQERLSRRDQLAGFVSGDTTN
jgi:hypothetical protein